ncbi:PDZ domain-containing protein [Streptomyces sp. NBC_00124]|uniref:PDZ domain-containing protein n=1 Tax=Streptomyces sp. NBC_00124 TaxID=2975662 RepID=UPI00225836B6|nr:PDZ domain-containing protein [Streptomyces sp. NBC_00124]MCX5360005.1 PDZ domain-containing protein [Streptomyces sp. NBC_00124]
MEQTALRPKPMPGQEPAGSKPRAGRHPHAAPRRGRKLRTLLLGLFVGTVLVLSGVGLGTVGATVIGMSRLAELQRQMERTPPVPTRSAPSSPSPSSMSPTPAPAPPAAALGVEAVDAEKAGALIVGVHVPGPGFTAGLVRGDVLLQVGKARVDSAADLARAVAGTRPGKEIKLTVRHQSGGYQQLTAVPGIVT